VEAFLTVKVGISPYPEFTQPILIWPFFHAKNISVTTLEN